MLRVNPILSILVTQKLIKSTGGHFWRLWICYGIDCDDSFIDVYFNAPSVNMTNWTQVGTTFTAYFDEMLRDVLVTLEVYN